jgi:hypothetical protein
MELTVVIKTKQGEFWTGTATCQPSFKKQKIKKFKHLAWVPSERITSRCDIELLIGDPTDISLYVAIDEFAAMYGYDVRPFALIKLKKGLNASNLWVDVATSIFEND